MHGKIPPVLVLEIDTRSEKEKENDRLRELARTSGRDSMEYDEDDVVDMSTMLKEYSGPMIERGPDMILSDHMEDGPGSSLFDESSASRYAKAMGISGDELDRIRAASMMEQGGPESLARFKQDYGEMKKYGGDVVAMELAREGDDMDDSLMDGLLTSSMDSTSKMDMSDNMNQAMSAMEEQFGRDAEAILDGEADGYFVFSVDCPNMGQVKYVYDSKDGVGRVLRG